jgi:tRNA (guanosine-2'-O-)-methyltransferase
MESVATNRDNKVQADRCKNLIAVIECGLNPKSIETIVRNINALGVEKLYIVNGKDTYMTILEIIARKPLPPFSEPKISSSFIKSFANTEECLEHLEKNKFTSIVISPHVNERTNVTLQEGDFTQKRLAVWFRNEYRGINIPFIERCKAYVGIEMYENVERLDISISTAMALYEITKQRRVKQKN